MFWNIFVFLGGEEFSDAIFFYITTWSTSYLAVTFILSFYGNLRSKGVSLYSSLQHSACMAHGFSANILNEVNRMHLYPQ